MIRAAQWHRVVEEAGERDGARRLSQRAALTKQPLSGTYELSVGATQDHEARAARLSVRCARVTFRRPKRRTKDQRALGLEELTPGVVEMRAVAAPQGLTPRHRLHGTRVWWTSLPVTSFDEAWQIIEDDERRWLIEEFHKTIKTGCRLEARQYMEAHRLEVVAGFTGVLAVRRLPLKTVATTPLDLPADRVVPAIWLKRLGAPRK